jgi:hypothetical protein
MELTLEAFRAIQWERNLFEVVERDSACISLVVSQLKIEGKQHQTVRFAFPQPGPERATLWDAHANIWIKHHDLIAPIGRSIVGAAVKRSHVRVMLSFAGHHALGPSRWGFAAQRILVDYEA